MLITKRNGSTEPVSKAKVHRFLSHVSEGKTHGLVETIMKGIPSNISASQLNTYFANTAQAAGYGLVAGRIEMMGICKQTSPSFTEAMLSLPLDPSFHEKIKRLKLDDHIIHNNDFTYDLFALRTLQRSYLMRDEHDKIIERKC